MKPKLRLNTETKVQNFKKHFLKILNYTLCDILELVVRLAHKYGLGEKKHPLPIYTFMHATVTTIVTICNNHISLKNDRSI